MTSSVRAGVLDVGYEQTGPTDGPAVVLLHGFPYDVRAYDGVVARLAGHGLRVVVPYLRGYGPTRFADASTVRSGQQAALAHDLVELLDALGIGSAVLAGYDWGGRAACIVAALWPDRVDGLVSVDGYNVQELAAAGRPAPPEQERSIWYQYYFHSERGRRALEEDREALCAYLWRTWSPTWAGAAAAFRASAASLHNPDFVDVVIHSYRHRYGLAPGDPRYQDTEDRIARLPVIAVPTVVLEAGADGVLGSPAAQDRDRFGGAYRLEALPGIGHDVPQEAPAEFAAAVLGLVRA